MSNHDEPPTTRTNAAPYERPVLIPVGDAENVVLGLPGGGDDQFGFSPWKFEFEEDNDESGILSEWSDAG